VTFLDPSFVIRTSSLIANAHLYTGRERDPETGLQLNRHRYYAAHLGRWVNRDPIAYADGMNLYMYGDSQPLVMTDPSGLLTDQEQCLGLCRIVCGADVVCMAACAVTCVPENPPRNRPPIPPGKLDPFKFGRCCETKGSRWEYYQHGTRCWKGWLELGTCTRLCSYECTFGRLGDLVWEWDGCGDCITPCK
jgi:RHS repeat-associated protein